MTGLKVVWLTGQSGGPSQASGLKGAPQREGAVRPGAGRVERLFLAFGLLVEQGAFLSIPTQMQGDGAVLEGGDAAYTTACALLLVGTALYARGMIAPLSRGVSVTLPYFLLPFLAIFSTLWSVAPGLTLKRSILMTGMSVFDLYVVCRLSLKEIVELFSRTIMVSAVASIVCATILPAIGRESGASLLGDWRGVFAQKNQLGHVMSTGAIVELYRFVTEPARRRRCAVGFGLCLLLTINSKSATSLLTLICGCTALLSYLCLRSGGAGRLVFQICALGVAILTIGALVADPDVVFALFNRDTTLTGRTDLWHLVIQLIRERPILGWGFQSIWARDSRQAIYIRDQIGWDAPNAHNGYLEVGLQMGCVGWVVLAVFLLWVVWLLVVRLRAPHAALGALSMGVLVHLLVASFSESYIVNTVGVSWNLLSILVLEVALTCRGDVRRRAALPRPASVSSRARPIAPRDAPVAEIIVLKPPQAAGE